MVDKPPNRLLVVAATLEEVLFLTAPAVEVFLAGAGGGPVELVDRVGRRDLDGVRDDVSDRPDGDSLDLVC